MTVQNYRDRPSFRHFWVYPAQPCDNVDLTAGTLTTVTHTYT